jgi:CHAT domain-containing protein
MALMQTRTTRAVSALLGCVLFAFSPAGSQQAAPADSAEGKDLLAQLSATSSPDAAADETVFQRYGLERSEKLLLTVVTTGRNPAATTDDWAAMHRALDALIELNVDRQQLFKASIYAGMQDSAYRSCEGDYAAALAAARQALDLQQRAGITATLSVPWQSIGADLVHLGRIDEGKAALLQAHQLIQDPTSSLAADIWREIISIESSQGNAAVAHSESEAFLRAAGPSTPAVFRANALLAAAAVAMDDHRFDDAASRIHEALHAIKGSPDATLFAYQAIDALLSLGMEAMQSLPYDEALSICARLDKDFPGLPISIAGFAHEIANHRRLLSGQFDLVLREDSAQLDRARAANDLSGQIGALMSSALDYAYLRESSQQIAALEEASSILHTPAADGVSPLLRFRLMNSVGAAQLAGGDLRLARGAYTEVLTGIEAITSAQMRTQLGGLYAEAQLEMASVTERDGDFKGARDRLLQMLNASPSSLGRFTRSTVLLQQARLEQAANQQPEEAIRLYLEAIKALHLEKDVNTEVYARLQLVQFIAEKTQRNAQHETLTATPATETYAALAREQLALSRTASTSIGLADSAWRIEFLEGILDQNAGDSAAAIRSFSAAADALDRIRAGLSDQQERLSFIDRASVQELYRRQIELLTAAGDRNRAWEFLERNKARSFLDTLEGRRFPASHSSSVPSASKRSAAELDAIEQQIVSARVSLTPENESTLRDSGRLPEVVRAKLIALEANFVLERQQQSLAGSRATQPLALRPISLANIQAMLPAHTALIEYAVLDHELAAFVVTHASSTELHWPADISALNIQLGKLSDLLSFNRGSEDVIDAQLASASEILLAPIFRVLPAHTQTLIIVPSHSLSLVPFQALPIPMSSSRVRGQIGERTSPASIDPEPRLLMIDRFAVAYLPSASTLQFLRFGPSSASPDLFLGAIGDLSVEGLPALPGTLDETAGVQRLYPRATRVTGLAFTHDAAVKALLEHQEVHFATHGLFEERAPLFSALITAPAPGQPSRLSLYEVMDLDLKARLVILSACATNRGRMTGGDEIAGFTRNFLQAGAENVVSSMWSVSDDSTALLMDTFHAHLRAGESTPLALRHAELLVRRKFPRPFYWAAFVDTGVR